MPRILPVLAALCALLLNLRSLPAQERTQPNGTEIVNVGETRASVNVTGRRLEIRGHVTGDVHAVNSMVVILHGAKVDGTVYLRGGEVRDQSASPARIVSQSEPAAVKSGGFHGAGSIRPTVLESPAAETAAPVVNTGLVLTPTAGNMDTSDAPQKVRKDWFGQQFVLLLLGLIGGLIIRFTAPRAASRVAEKARMEPARCLLIGGASAIGLGVVSLVNAIIMHTALRVVWTPVCLLLVFATLSSLAYGWLCGMRYVGDLLAPPRSRTSGSFYRRMTMGLGLFFMVDVMFGSISPALGTLGLLTQFAVALMGLGSAVLTRGGRITLPAADGLS